MSGIFNYFSSNISKFEQTVFEMKIYKLLIPFLFLASGIMFAQKQTPIKPTSAQERWNGFEQRQKLKEKSILNLEFRNVGPTGVSGRVTDIDANPNNPNEFYVSFASGGVWHTNNAGTTFSPIFDNEAVITIGDIAVDWKTKTIYVGTGESNSSRSSYAGMGVYKSSDQGKSWENIGLKDSHHIGRIILNPDNPNELWVASVGHLYSPNSERGIFKTSDGGKTWRKTLYKGETVGGIELQINPKNSKELYAGLWDRSRKAWDFKGSGTASGIYKSTDGGENWTLLTTQNSGFPYGEGNGRIGIAVYPENPDILYAVIDNWAKRPATKGEQAVKKVLDKARMKTISREEFMDLDEKDINAYLDDERFPDEYTAKKLKELLREKKITTQDIFNYTHNGNDDLFDIQIEGAEVYRSDDAGKTWRKTHDKNLDGMFYTYGYYFSTIWVSPTNPDKVVVAGVPVIISEDGGKTFKNINKDNVHADHHALWIDPKNDNFMINGNDGGINVTYDSGKSWKHLNPIPVSQFYDVDYDLAKPYNVYGGMQDNGVWYGPSTNRFNPEDGMFFGGDNFKFLMGGDGMQTRIDWRDNETLYTGFQFGNYFRVNTKTKERKYLEMPREIGEAALRFNWEAPFNISRHNQDMLYFGAQSVYRSMDKGDSWQKISGDLTINLPQGNVPFSTLSTLEESPKKFGLLYAGSDDGLVHISKDGGSSWQKIMDKSGLWISQIAPSKYSESRVYVTVNGYREDHFAPYLFVSENFGKTWLPLGKDLPHEPINVVREDPVNESILYVGTDNGLYISLDRGQTFASANNETLPQVSVHDLRIHHVENELIVGTHGRSIYIADVKNLQKLTAENLAKNLILHDLREIRFNRNWGRQSANYNPIKEPEYVVRFYNKNAGNATLNLYTDKDVKVYSTSKNVGAGNNSFTYNYAVNPANADLLKSTKADSGNYYLTAGKYKFEVCINGSCEKKDVEVKEFKPKTRREVPQGETSPGEFKQWRREAGYKKTL